MRVAVAFQLSETAAEPVTPFHPFQDDVSTLVSVKQLVIFISRHSMIPAVTGDKNRHFKPKQDLF